MYIHEKCTFNHRVLPSPQFTTSPSQSLHRHHQAPPPMQSPPPTPSCTAIHLRHRVYCFSNCKCFFQIPYYVNRDQIRGLQGGYRPGACPTCHKSLSSVWPIGLLFRARVAYYMCWCCDSENKVPFEHEREASLQCRKCGWKIEPGMVKRWDKGRLRPRGEDAILNHARGVPCGYEWCCGVGEIEIERQKVKRCVDV